MRALLSIVIVAALAATAGLLVRHYTGGGPHSLIGHERIDFTMTDVGGKPRRVSEWDGKVLMINFWATWCPPCQAEIPGFVKLQSEYGGKGLQIVGIAVDNRDAVRKFVHQHGINYPVLVGDEDGSLSRQYGDNIGALPYTVLIDRHGKVVATHRGLFARNEAETAIRPLL